jgi:hypothetical protein
MDGATTLEEIHRESDGELVGYISHAVRDGAPTWVARTLFGGDRRCPSRGPARPADAAT